MKTWILIGPIPAVVLFIMALLPGLALATQHREQPQLRVEAPQEVRLGEKVGAVARLTTTSGQAIPGAAVTFLTRGAWGEISGEMELGTAKTDATGVARHAFQARSAGAIEVIARFDGDERRESARAEVEVTVAGSSQLYNVERTPVGLVIPPVVPWVLGGVLATVWSLYFFVARLVLRIARAADLPPVAVAGPDVDLGRRRFLQNLVPVGMHAAIAPIGLGLATMVARGPYTHTNFQEHESIGGYGRTPFAHVGGGEELMEMLPSAIGREVSFSREVLPILLANAGPHAVVPKNSPPPQGVRLDGYQHIMAKEGLVVPGKPEESELVRVLVDPAMRMPPSISPIPEQQIQLIVSWVAQGAKDN